MVYVCYRAVSSSAVVLSMGWVQQVSGGGYASPAVHTFILHVDGVGVGGGNLWKHEDRSCLHRDIPESQKLVFLEALNILTSTIYLYI